MGKKLILGVFAFINFFFFSCKADIAEVTSGLNQLSEIERLWSQSFVHIRFTKTSHQNRDVQLRYFSTIPNYSSEKITKMTRGIRTDVSYIELMKFGDLIKIRRISEVTEEGKREVSQNIFAIYDGKITRCIGYPEGASLQEALDSKSGPIYDISRNHSIELDPNENPLIFLRETLGLTDTSTSLSSLLNSLVGLKAPIAFDKLNSKYVARFQDEFQTGEIEFDATVGYLPTARIYGKTKGGVEGKNTIEYTRISSPENIWFPKNASIKTYYVDGSKKHLMLEQELKVEVVEVGKEPKDGTFDPKSLPGIK